MSSSALLIHNIAHHNHHTYSPLVVMIISLLLNAGGESDGAIELPKPPYTH